MTIDDDDLFALATDAPGNATLPAVPAAAALVDVEVDDEGFSIRGLKQASAGYSLLPLGVLFTLNFVDEFDRIAFATLIPEIQESFGMSDADITALGAVTSVFALLASLPLGIFADRARRVRLSIIAGFVWGVAAVLTGLVAAIPLLYVVRFFSGVGRITNEVVHPSLLGDYYPRKAHPQVFGTHRLANALAPVAGPIAGVIGGQVSWQAAFFVLSVPTGLALFAATKLREPVRGESFDPVLAAQADDKAIPFGQARRDLFAIPTLKRLWSGAFFFGMGTLQVGNLISLYFDNVFGFGPTARGWVQFVLGAGTVVGLVAGSTMASAEVRAGRIGRLAFVVGIAFMPFAAGMIILAAAPIWPIALVGAFFVAAGNGGYQPAYFSIVGSVAPPRIRSQAYAWAVLIYGSGGLAYVFLFAALVGDEGSDGYRLFTVALALITCIAGLIGMSAQKFVEADALTAAASLETNTDATRT